LKFFLKFREQTSFREVVVNALIPLIKIKKNPKKPLQTYFFIVLETKKTSRKKKLNPKSRETKVIFLTLI
jgi:hypothetical protein